MGKSQRDKGKRWEREFAAMLRDVMPGADIYRSQQGDGAHQPDVVCPLFWPECKCGKAVSVRAALRQAQADSTLSSAPAWVLAAIKDDRKPPWVAMPMDDWLEMVSVLWRETRPREG